MLPLFYERESTNDEVIAFTNDIRKQECQEKVEKRAQKTALFSTNLYLKPKNTIFKHFLKQLTFNLLQNNEYYFLRKTLFFFAQKHAFLRSIKHIFSMAKAYIYALQLYALAITEHYLASENKQFASHKHIIPQF